MNQFIVGFKVFWEQMSLSMNGWMKDFCTYAQQEVMNYLYDEKKCKSFS